jgi:hypothetical protein
MRLPQSPVVFKRAMLAVLLAFWFRERQSREEAIGRLLSCAPLDVEAIDVVVAEKVTMSLQV